MSSFFYFKQTTAYDVHISDCGSVVCSFYLGTCVRMNDGIDLTVYAQIEMRIFGEDIDGTLAMPNRPLSGRIIMAYGACQGTRSEEHTSELQSLMRISYAVFCLKKKTNLKVDNNDKR